MSGIVIEARGLEKRFGKVHALRGVDLDVHGGTILGLLGPNGAGKSTLVRILATLLRPDAGTATVAGHDVVRHGAKVRRMIGLAGQSVAIDENLTGRENLILMGRFHHLSASRARERADELIARVDLADAARRPAKGYSGGMKRRLDLAASMMGDADVLFLDEPTTGLDPRSRLAIWSLVEGLRASGKTILLTTQYLEEADRLADRIAVVDRGVIIAQGTARELKARVGGDVVEVTLADGPATAKAAAALRDLQPTVQGERNRLTVPAADGAATLTKVVQRLTKARLRPEDVALRRPTLDDVFLAVTGHTAEEGAQ